VRPWKVILIVCGTLLSCALPLAIIYANLAIGDPLHISPHMHIQYEALQRPECKERTCITRVKMTNRNSDDYHLDFFGVDGPGPTERGTWGAYLIGKHNERCEATPEDSSYNMTLRPDTSTTLILTAADCSLRTDEISHVEVFEKAIYFHQLTH